MTYDSDQPATGSSHGRHHHRTSHTRSRSPRPGDKGRNQDRSRSRDGRQRSRSADKKARRQHRRRDGREEGDRRQPHHHRRSRSPAAPVTLPYGTRQLSTRDLAQLEPMFAMYLDIQKGLILEELDEGEVRGRWKSFVKRWNRGELSEGWYDPSTFERARAVRSQPISASHRRETPPVRDGGARSRSRSGMSQSGPEYDGSGGNHNQIVRREPSPDGDEEDDDDDESYGPPLPTLDLSYPGGDKAHRSGPKIPTLQDLELRHESAVEDHNSARREAHVERRAALHSHKTTLRSIEDEVAPRAEPGTHERKMEKRKETATANREFAATKRGGSPTEAVPETDLMGGGAEDDLEALRKERERERRKKNEREIRREEVLRARAAEREERVQKYREKEEETMGWLKALARQRFG